MKATQKKYPCLTAVLMLLALLFGTGAVTLGTATTAVAVETGGYPHWDMPCEHAPYAVTGKCTNYDWGPKHTTEYDDPSTYSSRGYTYRNCTDYVAWKLMSQGVAASDVRGLGHGGNWYDRAPAAKRSLTPKAGSAAVKLPSSANPWGHVAYVESVNSDGTITVSEYNRAGTGAYGIQRDSASALGFTRFVDFGVNLSAGSTNSVPPPPPSQPNILLARVGNTLYSKVNIGDEWTTQTTTATGVKASGGRIGITDTSGSLVAKDGPNGTWYTETGAVDQYVVTPNLLVIRVGGTVYAKAQLTDQWSTVVGGGATDIQAADNTMAFVDSNGTLWAKVGVNGEWQQEIGNVSQYVLASSLLLARVGNTLYSKANLGDAWTTQATGATSVKASGGRIVITDTGGTVYAKDGPNGTWYAETGATDQIVVTPNLLIIRVGGTIYAKAQLYDAWSTVVGGGATDVQAANNTMAFIDSNGTLWAKVGVNGTWQQEIGNVSQAVVS